MVNLNNLLMNFLLKHVQNMEYAFCQPNFAAQLFLKLLMKGLIQLTRTCL